jgi:hypothetical protein
MRRCRVFRPRRARKLSNGPCTAPTEFCRKAICSAELRVVADHQHAADHVGVAVEVLGRRVHDDVGAVFQRALQHRRGEGVVDRDQQAMPLGAMAAIAAISTIFSIGLVGVSIQTSLVFAVIAASNAAGSVRSTKLNDSPALRVRTRSNRR